MADNSKNNDRWFKQVWREILRLQASAKYAYATR